MARVQTQKAVKCEAASQALVMAEQERDALLEESNAAGMRISENARDGTRLQQQVAELHAAHEEAMEDKRRQFRELQAQVEGYNSTLLGEISNSNTVALTSAGHASKAAAAAPPAPPRQEQEQLAA